MYIARETQLREYVLKTAQALGYHESHIESPVTSAGIPDLNLFRGVDIWLELKVWNKDKGVKMRPTQKLWHLNRFRRGGLSWVMVHHGGRLSLVPGNVAARMGAKDPAWIVGYDEAPLEHVPELLAYMHRQVLHQLHASEKADRLATR